MTTIMDGLWDDFAKANETTDGYLLATTISPEAPASDPARLYNWPKWTNAYSLQTDLRYKLQYNPGLSLNKGEAGAWLDVFTAYYAFTGKLLAAEEAQNAGNHREADWNSVYESWKEVLSAVYRGYSSNVFEAWTIPCLYAVGKYLRIFAIKADDKAAATQRDSGLAFGGLQEEDAFSATSKNEKLEDAARQINRIFALCLGDRNPLEDSRKWALYYTANLLFKTYFRLNSIPLSKNILRSLRAGAADTPPLSAFPKAHQVTFNYYSGVLAFLEEDYATAESYLLSAYQLCNKDAKRNLEMILMYLIPTKLLTWHKLPTKELLQQSPKLDRLFTPFCMAIKRADLRAFNAALEAGEDEFVKRRVYLTLERGRDILLRNLWRKVFLAGGFETPKEGEAAMAPPVRKTRIPVREIAAALRLAGASEIDDGEGGVDGDEVECMVANTIYKNHMKGYIARDRGMVVLSKAGAFPGTGV
ncbi:COP9 signalosome (CSN) subunit [Elasticomyces elasticus]|nr:COP9 signalosome (CSN) subunit [Elasticomyces elasticus]KAK3660587.1 COP9 signalosome (CSN) subunit [Elasticomyces elasticus]KAK4915611.1 COP9 signalosome (CSN) subunit [Elasticomyces elasticus]KAK5755024.1 COP9 signalosome (CSN) subunit [Elasticomyces elasticus]